MYRLNFHPYPSHYSIPFEYHYKNTVNCRLNILQGNGTLFGILTQRFFNHYRSNKLYICAKRYLFNKLILTPPPSALSIFFTILHKWKSKDDQKLPPASYSYFPTSRRKFPLRYILYSL